MTRFRFKLVGCLLATVVGLGVAIPLPGAEAHSSQGWTHSGDSNADSQGAVRSRSKRETTAEKSQARSQRKAKAQRSRVRHQRWITARYSVAKPLTPYDLRVDPDYGVALLWDQDRNPPFYVYKWNIYFDGELKASLRTNRYNMPLDERDGTYTIKAVTYRGTESDLSEEFVPSSIAPLKPTNIRLEPTRGNTLFWDQDRNPPFFVSKWNIYLDGELKTSLRTRRYNLPTDGRDGTYTIEAETHGGIKSDLSDGYVVGGDTPATPVPVAPEKPKPVAPVTPVVPVKPAPVAPPTPTPVTPTTRAPVAPETPVVPEKPKPVTPVAPPTTTPTPTPVEPTPVAPPTSVKPAPVAPEKPKPVAPVAPPTPTPTPVKPAPVAPVTPVVPVTPTPAPVPDTPGPLPPQTDGPLSAPHPTIENVSLLWDTVGDSNRNGTVNVRYRQRGSNTWLPALPLRRVPGGSNEGFRWSDRHAGSLFGLNPGTVYEVEASLNDPDGPNDVRTISVTTRRVPTAMANAPVKPATPSSLSSVLSSAQPGDIILLGAGTYGEFEVNRSGTPGRPIVVRGVPGAVVTRELNIFGQSDVHVENLTVNGRIRFNGSDRIAITGNTINAIADRGGDGIVTFIRSEDSYIADNTITGRTTWGESSLGAQGDNDGEGIAVTGPGHVIEHNRVRGMRDGISFLEDSGAVDQFSIDVLRNEISEAGDDGVEADFCMHNCRVIDNRLTNTFIAFSSQPSLGGPTYFVRNTAYNVGHVAFKLYRGSQGDVLLHNTVVKDGDALGIYAGRSVSELYMRNNLLIGGPGDTYNGYSNGSGQAMRVSDLVESTADMNYNGYGSTTGSFTGSFGNTRFNSFAEMRSRTTETNSTHVALNVFASPVAFPGDTTVQFRQVDLRLAASSAAINAGIALPTINDAASGAPDLGAHEQGAPLPKYGPRS